MRIVAVLLLSCLCAFGQSSARRMQLIAAQAVPVAAGGGTCLLFANQTTDNDFWTSTSFVQTITNASARTVCSVTVKLARQSAVNTTVTCALYDAATAGTQYGTDLTYSLAGDDVTATFTFANVTGPAGNMFIRWTAPDPFRVKSVTPGSYANGELLVGGSTFNTDAVFELDTLQ